MTNFNKATVYSKPKLNNTSRTRFILVLKNYLKSGFSLFVKDMLLFYTAVIFLLKSILFIGLINNGDASSYDKLKAFHSFSSPPPLYVYFFFGVALLSFAYLFRQRLHFWFIVTLNCTFSLFLIADLIYYRGYGGFLSMQILNEPSSLHTLPGSILSLLRPVDLLFVSDLLPLILVGINFRKLYSKATRNTLIFLTLLGLSVGYIYSQHVKLDLTGNGDTMLFRVAWVPNQTMTNLSPIGYHLYDLYNYYLDGKPYDLTPEEQAQIKKWFAAKQENLPPNEFKGMYTGQNLIFIQVESLENSVINQKVNGQEITPNLNRLLQNSLYFSNFYEQVYNGNSSDADLLANTSIYPVRNGSTFFRFPNNTYNSLPKLLEAKGYTTLAAYPVKGSYWNWLPAITSIGFDQTLDITHFNVDEQIGLGISDASFLRQVASLITKQKQPFFAYFCTLSGHSPFDLPNQYRKLTLDPALDKSILGSYFQSIHYTDQQIQTFLDTLDKEGLLDHTVVVIYGDHTGVHKYYNDQVRQLKSPESWWLDDSKRVPFIIYHKGMRGQEIKTTGGQVDILPTVAYLMGVDEERYRNTAMGRNLLNTNKDFALLASGDYMGKAASDTERKAAVQAIHIADLIIRSNYFAKRR